MDLRDLKWCGNGHLVIWDTYLQYRLLIYSVKGLLLRALEPYSDALGIRCVQTSPDQKMVAVGSYDAKIRLIQSKEWAVLPLLNHVSVLERGIIDTEIYREDISGGRAVDRIVHYHRTTSTATRDACRKTVKYSCVRLPASVLPRPTNSSTALLGYTFNSLRSSINNSTHQPAAPVLETVPTASISQSADATSVSLLRDSALHHGSTPPFAVSRSGMGVAEGAVAANDKDSSTDNNADTASEEQAHHTEPEKSRGLHKTVKKFKVPTVQADPPLNLYSGVSSTTVPSGSAPFGSGPSSAGGASASQSAAASTSGGGINLGISQISWSPDSLFLASKNDQQPSVVWIWDVYSFAPRALLTHRHSVLHFAWSKDSMNAERCAASYRLWSLLSFALKNLSAGLKKLSAVQRQKRKNA